MDASLFNGTLSSTDATFPWRLQNYGDEPANVTVRGWPKTLVLYLHSWSGVMNECKDVNALTTGLGNCVIAGMDFGGPNNHPNGAGSPWQLERIHRVAEALRAYYPMIERTLIFGQSGGGYMGLMYMAAYPGEVYGASLWVFPSDLADWWTGAYPQTDNYRDSLQACLGGTPAQVPALYAERSPMTRTITNTRLYLNGSEQDTKVPVRHQKNARNRFAAMAGNTVVWNNGSSTPEAQNPGGHVTDWPVALAQLQTMQPPP